MLARFFARTPALLLLSLVLGALPAAASTAKPSPSPAAASSTAAEVLKGGEAMAFGRFGTVTVYRPQGLPSQTVLFVSGDGGWNLGVVDMARHLVEMDALVVGIDIRHYLKAAGGGAESCTYAAADFEALSKFVQKKLDLPAYHPPVLVGYSSGATLVYAVLVQAPPNTFDGALSLGFCPDLLIKKPFCAGHGLAAEPGPHGKGVNFLPARTLEQPWIAFQGDIDQICFPPATAEYVRKVPHGELVMLPKVGHGFSVESRWLPQFRDSFRRLAHGSAAETAPEGAPGDRDTTPAIAPGGSHPARAAAASRSSLADLPLVEVAAHPSAGQAEGEASQRMAVILSGDGGWASLDREVAGAFAERGIPSVGWNSLSYFWKARTPEGAAADLARVLQHYLAAWNRPRVLLVGYSLGADVLPFLVHRLPPDLLSHVELVALLGADREATFEFHLSDWLGGSSAGARPVLPEVERLAGKPLLCLYGERDEGSLCPALHPPLGKAIAFSGAHHLGGDYRAVAARILAELTPAAGR
jgi:type IV secretory pathway VirJ component